MDYYLKCFDKKIHLSLYKELSDLLFFWLNRFCPSIEVINKNDNDSYFEIMFIESDKYDYECDNNIIKIYGKLENDESFIAKFVTQCFQKLLIDDDILIVPAACVSKDDKVILVIGDFWQGKTSVAKNISSKFNLKLLTDNYVAVKKGIVIGTTNYLSVRKEDVVDNVENVHFVNDRYFYENDFHNDGKKKIVGFLLPYINEGDNNIHIISDEESKWYLYQKFSRLLSGEAVLFNGKLPSPIFLDNNSSCKILKIVDEILVNNKIKYVSSNMDKICEEGFMIFEGEKYE